MCQDSVPSQALVLLWICGAICFIISQVASHVVVVNHIEFLLPQASSVLKMRLARYEAPEWGNLTVDLHVDALHGRGNLLRLKTICFCHEATKALVTLEMSPRRMLLANWKPTGSAWFEEIAAFHLELERILLPNTCVIFRSFASMNRPEWPRLLAPVLVEWMRKVQKSGRTDGDRQILEILDDDPIESWQWLLMHPFAPPSAWLRASGEMRCDVGWAGWPFPVLYCHRWPPSSIWSHPGSHHPPPRGVFSQ